MLDKAPSEKKKKTPNKKHNVPIADIDFGMPISVENIIVHIMSKGDMYNLDTRKFMGAEIAMNEP